MKHTHYILTLLLASICSITVAQETIKTNFNGIWYTLSLNGNEKITVEDSRWLSESDNDEDNPYHRVDTIYIVKRLPHQLAIVKKPMNKKMALVRHSLAESNTELHTAILEAHEDISVLLEVAKQYDVVSALEIVNSRIMYSPERKKAIEEYPGFDEMKAQDLKTALLKRAEIGPLLQDYIEAHPEKASNPYYIYRLAEPFFQREFLKLGYNPFKQVTYNFETQFKDHPEIIKLLTEPF